MVVILFLTNSRSSVAKTGGFGIKHLFAIFLLSLTVAQVPGPAVGNQAVQMVDGGKIRVNAIGRQRMLSQRIAKAACLGVVLQNQEFFVVQAEQALSDFEETLGDLSVGNPDLGLGPEPSPRIFESVQGLRGPGNVLRALALSVDRQDTYLLRELDEYSLVVLRQSNDATNLIAKY